MYKSNAGNTVSNTERTNGGKNVCYSRKRDVIKIRRAA